MTIDPGQIRRHLSVLTRDIGVRLAGSRSERTAADYIAAEWERAGATVSVEEFPVRERVVVAQSLEVLTGGTTWQRSRRVSCELVAELAAGVGSALEGLAMAAAPFSGTVAEADRAVVARTWDELFGGWKGFGSGS